MARILIVEDNDMNWDMLSRRLERRGFQVTRALDGQEGVRVATARPPDLILMDMGLPVLDGWEATKILKGTPATAPSRSSASRRTPCRKTARRRSTRAATTTRPSRSTSRA